MEGGAYMSQIERFSTAKPLFCMSCGAETPSLSPVSFCSSCEYIVESTADELSTKAPTIVGALREIRRLADSGDLDGAIAASKALDPKMEDPSLLYSQALLHISYSNGVLANVSYNRQGFMYDNIDLKDRSLALISTSKRLLARAIVLLTDQVAKAPDYRMQYLLFLCQIKFGRLRGAAVSLESLDSFSQPVISAYAHIVFDAKTGNLKDLAIRLDQLASSGNIHLNSIFYSAYIDIKKRRVRIARMKLAALTAYSDSQSVGALIEGIKEASSPQ